MSHQLKTLLVLLLSLLLFQLKPVSKAFAHPQSTSLPLSLSLPNPSSTPPTPPQCKCLPSQPCWPTPLDFHNLATKLSRPTNLNLTNPPVALPCYPIPSASYDPLRCQHVRAHFHDSAWRADQPGAMQHVSWEVAGAGGEEGCYLPAEGTGTGECKQGAIPPIVVRAETVGDVIATVQFARRFRVPLVVKNTGHDFLGRAAAGNTGGQAGSVMLWTRWLEGIEVVNGAGGNGTAREWYPEGCPRTEGFVERETLLRVAAGMQWHHVYRKAAEIGRSVVGGASPTVGVVGGYIQGGGHSMLSPWKGLASDHVVELEVVTADGNIVTASPCKNVDLFWALRGGGGGTFGVVTHAVLRTFEDPPITVYNLNVTIPIDPLDAETALTKFYALVERFHELVPGIDGLNGGGYYYVMTDVPIGAAPDPGGNGGGGGGGGNGTGHGGGESGGGGGPQVLSVHQFIMILHFPHSPTHVPSESTIKAFFAPFETWVYTHYSLPPPLPTLVTHTLTTAPSISLLLTALGTTDPTVGGTSILGSRLLSRTQFLTKPRLEELTTAFRHLRELGGGFNVILGHVVAGSGVARGPRYPSAAHPAWRRALVHVVVTHGWAAGDPPERVRQVRETMTKEMVPVLKRLDWVGEEEGGPGGGRQEMGSYVNEADKEEEGWQESFWGGEGGYEELRRAKRRWDPEGVFWCRPCVGSEEWDREGVCRVPVLF